MLHISYAMEIDIPNVTHVAFLTDNSIIMASNTCLTLYDLNTQSLIDQVSHPKEEVNDIAIDKTQSYFAVSRRTCLERYSVETKKLVKNVNVTKDDINPIVFSSQNNNNLITILRERYNALVAVTSLNEPTPNIYHIFQYSQGSYITCHPNAETIVYVSVISQHFPQNFQQFDVKTRTCSTLFCNAPGFVAAEYQYSPDAQYVLINQTNNGLSFQKSNDKKIDPSRLITCKKCKKHDPRNLQFLSTAFHSGGLFFVTLSHKGIVDFWHCKNVLNAWEQNLSVTPYHSIPLSPENSCLDTEYLQKRLSFSPDGTHLVVALSNKCIVLPALSVNPELEKTILLLLNIKNNLQ